MGLEQRTYSILIVSSAEKFNSSLKNLLPPSQFHTIQFLSDINTAKRELLERSYDFILINAPLPDDFGTDFAMDIACKKDHVVLLIIRSELYEEIYDKVTLSGVFTLPKPTSRQMVLHALDWMITLRERLRLAEKKNMTMEEKMEEIRLINRAKWALIDQLKMSEADAHRYIEKRAMDQCVSRREIAEDIIRTYL